MNYDDKFKLCKNDLKRKYKLVLVGLKYGKPKSIWISVSCC